MDILLNNDKKEDLEDIEWKKSFYLFTLSYYKVATSLR